MPLYVEQGLSTQKCFSRCHADNNNRASEVRVVVMVMFGGWGWRQVLFIATVPLSSLTGQGWKENPMLRGICVCVCKMSECSGVFHC